MASGLKMGPRSELASLSKELKKKKILHAFHSTCGAATSILTMHISEPAGAELLDKFQL